ncbi:MAG: DUF3054 domain-containing protein [bacterium]|nr:DUF3054 domain-containing protein [bacterium]
MSTPAQGPERPSPGRPTAQDQQRPGDDIPAILTDLALVTLFVVIGRIQHEESLAIGDLARGALPFWAGLLIGHVILRLTGKDPRSLAWGGFLVVATWALGHAGRLMLTQGSDPAFLAVSAAVLTLFLMGWRLGLRAVGRRLQRSRR